jgi:stage II sporulation protein D
MRRAAFLSATAGALLLPAGARATGGLDVPAPGPGPDVRVLLTSDVSRAPAARPLDDRSFSWNGRTYRGRYEMVGFSDGRTGLLDVVPLEQYLYGVVGRELAAGWPQSSLQAQAIVARTYTVAKLRPQKAWDMIAGEADQLYGGAEVEAPSVTAAVDATAGSVVTYDGRLAHVAYSSCCGGHTADAAELWGTVYPYMRGVTDSHCSAAPEFHWQRVMPYDEFARALGDRGLPADVTRVDLRDLDGSWRPRRVGIVGDSGTGEIKLATFRTMIGPSIVRSTLLQSVTVVRGQSVTFAGAGYGHGAGLCQWGTRYMALDGQNAQAIVLFYFPGTTLGRA